jgi:hypothetical protein
MCKLVYFKVPGTSKNFKMAATDRLPFVSDYSLRRVATCRGEARVSELFHYFSYHR